MLMRFLCPYTQSKQAISTITLQCHKDQEWGINQSSGVTFSYNPP